MSPAHLQLDKKPMCNNNTGYRNTVLVEQAREDALEMHKASKREGLRKHVRKFSAKF